MTNWKLLGGRRYTKYNSDDKYDILAALFFCVTLDVYFKNLLSFLLVRTAINSHLRIVVSMDQSIGVIYIITLFEPVLALVTLKLLCKGNNWIGSIKILAQQLFQLGLVAKRLKKELFAHLMMIFTRDQIQSSLASQNTIQTSSKGCKAQEKI